MKTLICCLALVCCSACATVQNEAMPRAAGALEAIKAAWVAVCVPTPIAGGEKQCADAKAAVNKAVDVYTDVNDALKEAQ